ncbi:MAG: hypothetical protein DRR08_21065 [Candidatus Parabeggiatoa sp. nov. 2]|nr:MAG: hypothetical protein B6247_26920 [Beggiatoa sp. 4572_84]RKZ56685.1 MAG: hypothetical protein DRR08_21065 [Gammaproteobacteria bacterium]HEC85828.1 hypothetical protein [Thioploca sp.]
MPNTLKKNLWGALFMLSLSQTALAVQEDCDYATDLLFYAYHLHRQGGDTSQQKLLLSNSLRFCANQPKVHNTLASILKKQGKPSEAAHHYKQAIGLHSNFSEAWDGLGDAYYKQALFPLSLEAYSHACKTDKYSKARIMTLLRNKAYAITGKSKVIDKENLLVLYNHERRQALNKRLSDCGLRDSEVRPLHIFSNLHFESNKATLREGTEQQLDEIAAALRQTHSSQVIKVHGHTDAQGFLHVSAAESDRRNLQLSQERAAAIVTALAQRGIPKTRLKSDGHGSKQPLVQGTSQGALAANRRTEIEVEPVVTKKSEDDIEEYK